MCGCGRTSAILAKPGRKIRRPDVVEEDERPHHLVGAERQYAPDLEATEVAAALVNYSVAACPNNPG